VPVEPDRLLGRFAASREVQLRQRDLGLDGRITSGRLIGIAESVIRTALFDPVGAAVPRGFEPSVDAVNCRYVGLGQVSGRILRVGIAVDVVTEHSIELHLGFFHGPDVTDPYALLRLRLRFVDDPGHDFVPTPASVARNANELSVD